MEAYAAMPSPQTKAMGVMDKLSYEISLLESKFLFGVGGAGCLSSGAGTPARAFLDGGRVWVLSIDWCGAGSAEDAFLAAAVLAWIKAGLREQAGDDDARITDFFDVAAGAGVGAVLAVMLFLRGDDGRPRYTAQEALAFIAGSVCRKDWGGWRGRWAKLFRGARSGGDRMLCHVYRGKSTLPSANCQCHETG